MINCINIIKKLSFKKMAPKSIKKKLFTFFHKLHYFATNAHVLFVVINNKSNILKVTRQFSTCFTCASHSLSFIFFAHLPFSLMCVAPITYNSLIVKHLIYTMYIHCLSFILLFYQWYYINKCISGFCFRCWLVFFTCLNLIMNKICDRRRIELK